MARVVVSKVHYAKFALHRYNSLTIKKKSCQVLHILLLHTCGNVVKTCGFVRICQFMNINHTVKNASVCTINHWL